MKASFTRLDFLLHELSGSHHESIPIGHSKLFILKSTGQGMWLARKERSDQFVLKKLENLARPRENKFALAQLGQRFIFAFNVRDEQRSLDRLDTRQAEPWWEPMPPLNLSRRELFSSCTFGQTLYVFGGRCA